MNPIEAADLVRRSLHEVAPDVNLDGLDPDADLRETLDLDSLDFLQFVELLSERSGVRIDEENYPALDTFSGAVGFLVDASTAGAAR